MKESLTMLADTCSHWPIENTVTNKEEEKVGNWNVYSETEPGL